MGKRTKAAYGKGYADGKIRGRTRANYEASLASIKGYYGSEFAMGSGGSTYTFPIAAGSWPKPPTTPSYAKDPSMDYKFDTISPYDLFRYYQDPVKTFTVSIHQGGGQYRKVGQTSATTAQRALNTVAPNVPGTYYVSDGSTGRRFKIARTQCTVTPLAD